jgi:hypothetical protein
MAATRTHYDRKQTTLSLEVALAKPYAIRKALELSR